MELVQWIGKKFMEVFVFAWWRSHQSLAHKGLRFLRFCIVLWKGEQEPTIKHCMEDRLTWFRSSPEFRTWDKIDGEPMEFEWIVFPRFTRLSSCRCSTASHGDLKTIKKNANQVLNSFLSMRKDFHKDNGHSWDLDQNRSGMLLVKKVHKETGTELQSKWCWYFCKKQTPNLPIHESIIQRIDQKAKVVENCQYTISLIRERLKLFFAHSFLSISSVFAEQLQTCMKNVTTAMIEQGDLLWKENPTL